MSDPHGREHLKECGQGDLNVLVLLKNVEHADSLLEYCVRIVRQELLQGLRGRRRVLPLQQYVKVSSRRRLLELNITTEQVVDADRLLDWKRGRCASGDFDL